MPALDGPTTINLNTPILNISKTGFVIGNDVQFQRTVTGFLAADTPINAWLTIKSSPAMSDASGVQSSIGLISSGFGQIVGTSLTFNLLSGDTIAKLRPGPLYYYDIKLQATPSGRVYTIEQGFIEFLPEVGDLPSPGNASVYLPPTIPPVLFGPNPPPPGTYMIGTRYWVTPPIAGFPAEWVWAQDLQWRVTSVVSQ